MTRGLLLALIGGIVSAILPLGFLAPIPVLVVGFYLGSPLAGISAGVAALLVLLTHATSSHAILYIAGIGIPALLIIHLVSLPGPATPSNTAKTARPDLAGQVLTALSVYGILVLAGLAIFLATTGNTLGTAAQGVINDLAAVYTDSRYFQQLPTQEQDLAKKVIELVTPVASPTFTGLSFSYFLLALVGIAAAVQGWLNRIGQALYTSPSYIGFALPRWLTGILVITIAIAYLPGALGSFGLNAALFLSTPFFLLGLTVIHTLSRRSSMPGLALAAFYIGLFLFGAPFGLALPLLALLVILGFVEQWFSLRQRFAAPGANQEDE